MGDDFCWEPWSSYENNWLRVVMKITGLTTSKSLDKETRSTMNYQLE